MTKVKRIASLLFPGQGSRFGLNLDLHSDFFISRLVFELVDEAVGACVSKALLNATDAELMRTELAQPALLAHSIASLAALRSEVYGNDLAEKMTLTSFDSSTMIKEEIGDSIVSCVMGHSVGEYAALVAARSLSIDSAAKILKLRSRSMQKAADMYSAKKTTDKLGMIALLLSTSVSPLEDTAKHLTECCIRAEKFGGRVNIAGLNSPQQIVLSGELATIERTVSLFNEKSKAIKRMVSLAVSAPFHSSIMSSAAEDIKNAASNSALLDGSFIDDSVFRQASESFQLLSKPSCDFISNVSAQSVDSIDEIKSSLFESITKPVRWAESINTATNKLGVNHFIAFGSATSLVGLVKQSIKLSPESIWTIGTTAEVKEYVSFINRQSETKLV